jgi:hypothetical protein
MKKLVAIAGAGAMLLITVTPAFAKEHRQTQPQTSLTNFAVVTNNSSADSNTGGNGQIGGGSMVTGNAGAVSTAVVVANTTVSTDCHCLPNKISNGAFVMNGADASANTGMNGQTVAAPKTERHDKYVAPTATMVTGNAHSNANAWSVVNTTVSL